MKVTISITIFILEIGCIYSDITSEWKGWSETCCEILYKDDKNIQNECVNQFVKDIKGTLSENIIKVHLENKEVDAEVILRNKLIRSHENIEKTLGLSNYEFKKIDWDQIFEQNKSEIDAVRKEARTKRVKDFTETFQKTCDSVSKQVAALNDPNTFTVDVNALIITSEILITTPNVNDAFIEHLKENKEDVQKLKELGADFWQKLIYLDQNVFNFMKTCNCKNILLTKDFYEFLNRSMKYKRAAIGSYEYCPLDIYVEIYKKHKALIDSPKKLEATVQEDVFLSNIKNCAVVDQ